MILTYEYQYTDNPSEALIRGVAVAWNVPPSKLVPLYNAIDPDALDALFKTDEGNNGPDITVRFVYMNIDITVSSTQIKLDFQYNTDQETVKTASFAKE